MQKEPIQSLGGRARAESLTAEERHEIAKRAAEARWSLPRATHESETLKIADLEIPCAVLNDGTRVITSAGMLKAMNRPWRGKYKRTELPNFLAANNLQPLIDKDLRDVLKPVEFTGISGARKSGFDARLLPKICEVYLRARDEKLLRGNQNRIAERCEILMRALAQVGIIALVDEATGYQDVRDRQALQAILDKYLREEFAAWAKRFPDEFYKEIFRLRGWKWRGMKVNRPQVVAKYTKDFVYARLAPGIVEELEARNPKDSRGQRKVKHHQFLTDDIGHPALAQHLYAVVGLMRVSDSWDQFKRMIDRAFPKRGDTLQLELFSDDMI